MGKGPVDGVGNNESLYLHFHNYNCMISIKTFVFNTFMVNCYLLYDETGEAIVVDAACSDEREENQLVDFIRKKELELVRNINTHCHVDHVLGNAFIEDRFGLRPEYHKESSPFFYTIKGIAASFGYQIERIPDAGEHLKDGEVIRWGTSELKVLYTPGHADGSVCLYNEPQGFVLTGDVLFRDSIGRTDLDDVAAIQKRSDSVPVDTVIVSEQILGLEAKGHRFTQLLDHPIHIRVSCDREAYNLTPTVIKHKEDIESGEVESRNGEEIDGPRYVHVITQERKPCG